MHTRASHLRLVNVDTASCPGELRVPDGAHALMLMVFADPTERARSGFRFCADVLQSNGVATLAVDLHLPRRARGRPDSTTADTAADVLRGALRFAADRQDTRPLPIGLFAADEAVPACLAADRRGGLAAIRTLVLVDGHPDLSPDAVSGWHRPVLCLAGRKPLDEAGSAAASLRPLPSPHGARHLPAPTHPEPGPGVFEAIACETVAWLHHALPANDHPHPGIALPRHAPASQRSIVTLTTPSAGATPWPTSPTTRWD